VGVCVRERGCVRVRERVRECMCAGKYVCMCVRVYVCMCVCVYVCMCVCVYEGCWMYVTVSESVWVRERLCENI